MCGRGFFFLATKVDHITHLTGPGTKGLLTRVVKRVVCMLFVMYEGIWYRYVPWLVSWRRSFVYCVWEYHVIFTTHVMRKACFLCMEILCDICRSHVVTHITSRARLLRMEISCDICTSHAQWPMSWEGPLFFMYGNICLCCVGISCDISYVPWT